MPRQSRRNFLQQASTAAAAPFFVSGFALASPRAVGANERIGLGIIGAGQRGHQLARDLPDESQIVAVCDADDRKTGSLTQEHDAAWGVYRDYRAMLDNPDIDAVLITATDIHHVQAGILACLAGKDIYVEKPLSVYVREGRALVDAVRKLGRVAQTGTQQRSMELNRFACEFVRDGGIGEIKAIECCNYRSAHAYKPGQLPEQPVPPELDWDLWQGAAPERPYNIGLAAHWEDGEPTWWGEWRAYGGHAMTGLGAHGFDMVQYAMGADETGPVEFWPVEEGPEARIHFRYANGVEVRLRFTDQRPYRGPRLGAIFTGAECKIEINRNKYTTNPRDFIKDGPDPAVAKKWEGDGWVAKGHVQDWLDCIKSRERPVADVEIGHRTATLCHLCTITRQLGRRLRWNPDAEMFVDDAEANKLLDRPRRKGWELPTV